MSMDDTWDEISIGRMFAYAYKHHRAHQSRGTQNMSELLVEHLLDYMLAIPSARRQFLHTVLALLPALRDGTERSPAGWEYRKEEITNAGRTDLSFSRANERLVVELKVLEPLPIEQLTRYRADTLGIVATRDLASSARQDHAGRCRTVTWNVFFGELARTYFSSQYMPFWAEICNTAESLATVGQPLHARVGEVRAGQAALWRQHQQVMAICKATNLTLSTGNAESYFWLQSGLTGRHGKFGVSWQHDITAPEPYVGYHKAQFELPLSALLQAPTSREAFLGLAAQWRSDTTARCEDGQQHVAGVDALLEDVPSWANSAQALSGCPNDPCKEEASWYRAVHAALTSGGKGEASPIAARCSTLDAALKRHRTAARADLASAQEEQRLAGVCFAVLGRAVQEARDLLRAHGHELGSARHNKQVFGLQRDGKTVRVNFRTGLVVVGGRRATTVPLGERNDEATARIYVERVLAEVKQRFIDCR